MRTRSSQAHRQGRHTAQSTRSRISEAAGAEAGMEAGRAAAGAAAGQEVMKEEEAAYSRSCSSQCRRRTQRASTKALPRQGKDTALSNRTSTRKPPSLPLQRQTRRPHRRGAPPAWRGRAAPQATRGTGGGTVPRMPCGAASEGTGVRLARGSASRSPLRTRNGGRPQRSL